MFFVSALGLGVDRIQERPLGWGVDMKRFLFSLCSAQQQYFLDVEENQTWHSLSEEAFQKSMVRKS